MTATIRTVKIRPKTLAEAEGEAIARDATSRSFLEQLEDHLAELDDAPLATEDDPVYLATLKQAYREGITTHERAAAAAKRLQRADDEYEQAKAAAQVLEQRAKRRRARVYTALWGGLIDWADHQERRGKSVHLAAGAGRITYRATKASVAIDDPQRVLRWIRSDVGLGAAIERGLLHVKQAPSRSGLVAWLEETGEVPEGVTYTPPCDKPSLVRERVPKQK